MIYDDRHLFVALPKCASTFVQVLLQRKYKWRSSPHEPFPSWQHRPLCLAPEHIWAGREVFAVIRSPWAWYRSLYAYGMKTGYMRKWETGKHHDFHGWLSLLLDGGGHQHLPQGQKLDTEFFSALAKWDIGYLTFNYVLQCSIAPGQFLKRRMPPNEAVIGVQKFLRCEKLDSDLSEYLGIDCAALAAEPKANVNTTGHYSQDYTPELAALVAHKERLICERFGYRFEEKPCDAKH